jgi:hypothetical protein
MLAFALAVSITGEKYHDPYYFGIAAILIFIGVV